MFANLAQTRVAQEEGISAEELPPIRQPGDKPVGGPNPLWAVPHWAGGPGQAVLGFLRKAAE